MAIHELAKCCISEDKRHIKKVLCIFVALQVTILTILMEFYPSLYVQPFSRKLARKNFHLISLKNQKFGITTPTARTSLLNAIRYSLRMQKQNLEHPWDVY